MATPERVTFGMRPVLLEQVWLRPTEQVAFDIGVSSSRVKKRCKRLHIPTPPRGYWQKKAAATLEVIAWPTDDDLRNLVDTLSTEKIALQLGVTAAAVTKRCRTRNISLKPRGYWARKST